MILGQMQESATNDELVKGKHRSSSPRQAKNVMRERALGHDRIFVDYFVDNFTYLNLHF
jgi:hypothetical protein